MPINYLDRGDDKSNHFFDKEDNLKCIELIREWRVERVKEIEEFQLIHGKTTIVPCKVKVPDFVAICIMKICSKLASRHNYQSYTYREDMVSEAIANIIRYLHSFDPDKIGERSNNVNFFGWVTGCADRTFGSIIENEKTQEYYKNSSFLYSETYSNIFEDEDVIKDTGHTPEIHNDYINRAQKYEQKVHEKKVKVKTKKALVSKEKEPETPSNALF